MITVFVRDCNQFSQSFYDSIISSIQLHRLTCSCGHRACFHIHGYYIRYVKCPEGKMPLRICRVRCSECRATHALLLSSIVPYSQISLMDQQQICIDYEQHTSTDRICDTNPLVDENNVKAIRRIYRLHWREMLRSLKIQLMPIAELTQACFSNYSMQFMQIRRRFNSLVTVTT